MTTQNYVSDSREVAIIIGDMQLEMLLHMESITSDYLKSFQLNVGYLRARFEYFQVRFVLQPIPVMITLVPDRTQRALSISLITFFLLLSLVTLKRKILQKSKKVQQ